MLLKCIHTYMVKEWRHCNSIDWPFSNIGLYKCQCSYVPQLNIHRQKKKDQEEIKLTADKKLTFSENMVTNTQRT